MVTLDPPTSPGRAPFGQLPALHTGPHLPWSGGGAGKRLQPRPKPSGTAGHTGSSPLPRAAGSPWVSPDGGRRCLFAQLSATPAALALGGGNCLSDPVQCVVLGLPVAMATSSKACDVLYPSSSRWSLWTKIEEFSLGPGQLASHTARPHGLSWEPGGMGAEQGPTGCPMGTAEITVPGWGGLSAPVPAAWGPWDLVVLGTEWTGDQVVVVDSRGAGGGLGRLQPSPFPGRWGSSPSWGSCFPAQGQG